MLLRQAFSVGRRNCAFTKCLNSPLLPRFYATEIPPPKRPSIPENDITPNEPIQTPPPKLQGNAELLQMLEEVDGEEQPKAASETRPKYKSTADRKRERMANVFLGLFIAGAVGGVLYLGVETPESEAKGYTPGAWWQRVRERFSGQVSYYTEPAFKKLLADPLPPAYQQPYTLILDLDDLLITSSWSREHGYRTAKRPGLDYFLGYLSQYYEIVIFTNQLSATAAPILQKLDPYRSVITHGLFRESARYEDGKLIKDLNYMNRPLDKIIVIDTNPDHVSSHPENAILLSPWKGEVGPNSNAKELLSYMDFLEYLALIAVDDVRVALKSYEGTHIPTEYARREQELRDKVAAKRSRGSFLGGNKKPAGKVELFIDQERARHQKAYADHVQYLKENGERLLAEEKAREEAMLKEAKTSLAGFFLNGPPQPQQPQQK